MTAFQKVGLEKEEPVIIDKESYTSSAFAKLEEERLWPRAWQVACRAEEIPNVGDYVTYDIVDESIIVVRSAPDKIEAFFNVCQHRGRRLTEGDGNARQFFCRFHGWKWNVDGSCAFILDKEDWGGCLTEENTALKRVQCDSWGGWVWINMDPDCEPLAEHLAPVIARLGPFEFDKMRYRWRQRMTFPCNWKVAIEAFIESYHVLGTHPQLIKWGEYVSWSRAEGRHAYHGFTGPRGGAVRANVGLSGAIVTGNAGQDPRQASYQFLQTVMDTVNGTTTDTFVNAARRLMDELPDDATPELVSEHLSASAKKDDAARGVIWPEIDPADMAAAGFDWMIFPNTVVLFGVTFALCYRVRPDGHNPDSCIFEGYVIERFPEGQEPKTEWLNQPDVTEAGWRKVLSQDFKNMPEVQRGSKSRGFDGPRPSPVQEVAVTHLHRVLAEYLGTEPPAKI